MSEKAQLIMKSAEQLFAGGRYHEITLDQICKEAGVGKGTVYRYFKDKEDLYHQMIISGLNELVDSVRRVADETTDSAEGLRLAARRMGHFFNERKGLFGLMWSEHLRGTGTQRKFWHRWRKESEKMTEVLAGFIRKGAEDGRYDLGEFSPEGAASLLMAMLRSGMRSVDLMPGGKDWPAHVVVLFENGLLKR